MDPFTNYENRLQVFKDKTRGFYETRALDHTKAIFDAIDMYHPGKVISGSDKTAIKAKPTVVKPKIKSKKGGKNTRRKLKKTKYKLSKRSKLTKRHNLIKRKSRRR
jgi:hypothetical protein